jgi:hypothetical protein
MSEAIAGARPDDARTGATPGKVPYAGLFGAPSGRPLRLPSTSPTQRSFFSVVALFRHMENCPPKVLYADLKACNELVDA